LPEAVAITCQGVSKRFALVDSGNAWRIAFGAQGNTPVHQALSDVSFIVPKGEFVGILGRNGAGKSTLLRVLGGVYTPDSGSVAINGDLSGIYELGTVGNTQLTGRAYAHRLLTIHGFRPARREAMVADIHDFSELGDRFEDPVQSYSAGMAARLFFATATAGSYDVYLLDEVLSVGDQHFQAKCWRRMRDRISQGASGVLVTHDWSAIVRMCNSAHVLKDGKVVLAGPAEKAARYYLYGEISKQTYETGEAWFTTLPEGSINAVQGDDLTLRVGFRSNTAINVGCTCAIERLQPGYGWETALMTRGPALVAPGAGDYEITLRVPKLPLAPGKYQISLHLTTPNPDAPGRLRLLDGRTWLNGDGIALDVSGDQAGLLKLPLQWRVNGSQAKAA
jgi:lipopolysaccharide transport system ATP-binding protein